MPGPWSLPTVLNDGDPGQLAWGETVGAALNGATPDPTPSELVLRDAAGRMAAADPVADDDVATKGYVDPRSIQVYPDVAAVNAVTTAQFGRIDLEDVTTLIPETPLVTAGSTVWVQTFIANDAFGGPLPPDPLAYAPMVQYAEFQYGEYQTETWKRVRYWDGSAWLAWGAWSKVTDTLSPAQQFGNFTLTTEDAGVTIRVRAAATVTIPTNATEAIPLGSEVQLVRDTAGAVSIAASGGVTLLNPYSTANLRAQGSVARLVKISADIWTLTGDIDNANNAIQSTLVDAKGDLIVATGPDAVTRLPIGPDTYILTADSAVGAGMKWAAGGGGGGGGDGTFVYGRIPGRRYNTWHTQRGSVQPVMVANRMWLTGVFLDELHALSAVMVDSTTANSPGALLRYGIYSGDGVLLADWGQIDASTGGRKIMVVNFLPSDGSFYYLALVSQGASHPAVRLREQPNFGLVNNGDFGDQRSFRAYFDGVSGAFPATLPAPTGFESASYDAPIWGLEFS